MENGKKFKECAFLNNLKFSLNSQLNKRNLIVFPTCFFFVLFLTLLYAMFFSKFSRTRPNPRKRKKMLKK